jgi:hypothetical protein
LERKRALARVAEEKARAEKLERQHEIREEQERTMDVPAKAYLMAQRAAGKGLDQQARAAAKAAARVVSTKALVEDHRASEHLFKPSGPASEEEAVAAGWKPGPALKRALERVGAPDVTPEMLHEEANRLAVQAGRAEREGAKAFQKKSLDAEERGPASMEAEDERHYAAAERAKYDAQVGAGRFASSSRESREKFLKDVDKHGLDRALLRHGEREPHAGAKLRDPQKEQLARLRQARVAKSIQVGPRGGKHYVTTGGTKIYVRD